MCLAQNREEWRRATKFKPPDHLINSYHKNLIGRTVEKKFNTTWHTGVITQRDRDEATNEDIWLVEYADGDASDYNLSELKEILISECDALATANLRLAQPNILVGCKFHKYFGDKLHEGNIISHDEDSATGNIIWEVHFNDGDRADYDIQQITLGLKKPPPRNMEIGNF
jgi:hypothetical protein